MTVKLRLIAMASVIGVLGCPALAAPAQGPGQVVLDQAFDPSRIFGHELAANSDDQLILSVWASARDDYAPAYSLAVAYRCAASEKPGERKCSYTARMLRTGSTVQEMFGRSLELAGHAKSARSAADMRNQLDKASLQWLEADLESCPKGIFAMDSVRVADWRPDIHYALQAPEDRELIMHPAQIRIRMSGSYSTSAYEGWVLAAGVPAAVRQLTETLSACWKPATAARPWRVR